MLRCPVCRADNEHGPNCRRCKADLGMLFALDQQRTCHINAAKEAMREDNWSLAEFHLVEAATIRSDGAVHGLEATLALLRGDFDRAWVQYRVAAGMSPKDR